MNICRYREANNGLLRLQDELHIAIEPVNGSGRHFTNQKPTAEVLRISSFSIKACPLNLVFLATP